MAHLDAVLLLLPLLSFILNFNDLHLQLLLLQRELCLQGESQGTEVRRRGRETTKQGSTP